MAHTVFNQAQEKLKTSRTLLLIALILTSSLLLSGCVGSMVPGTSWTNWMPIDQPASTEVRCSLTINNDGSLSNLCKFRSTDGTAKRFVFCEMLDLVSDKQSPDHNFPGAAECNLEKINNVVQCVPTGGSGGGSNSSYYMGCKEVNVPANGETTITFDSNGPYIPQDEDDIHVWDFQVNYVDSWTLTGGTTFDAASCQKLTSQGGFLYPDWDPDSAIWIVPYTPFDDPFVTYQPIGMSIPPKVHYALLDDMPCAPEGFPITNRNFPRCPVRKGEAPPTTVDLNLFWWQSHMAEKGTENMALIEHDMGVLKDMNMDGIRIHTEPQPGKAFNMPGGEETFGSLRLCSIESTDKCLAPKVEDGRTVTVRTNFNDPDSGKFLFHESVTFIKDTVPPRVTNHTAKVDSKGVFRLKIAAEDKTTSPIFANLWYSTDGKKWTQKIMTSSDKGEMAITPEKNFYAEVEVGDAKSVKYYVGVQDLVYNTTYFGVGEATR